MTEHLYSVDAEQIVLGSLMLDPALLDHPVLASLSEKAFYFQGHQAVFRAISKLQAQNRECDSASVWTALGVSGEHEHVGSLSDLTNIEAWGKPRTAVHHAGVVGDWYRLRCVLERLNEATSAVYGSGDASTKVDRIAGLLSGLDASNGGKRSRPMSELMVEAMDRLNEAAEGKLPTGWATGIPTLDRLHGGGLRAGKLYIAAARPGVGKSSLSMHIAAQVARSGHAVMVVSQEMEDYELATRALANAARVECGNIESGKLTDDEWSRIAEGVDELGNSNIWVNDEPGQTLHAINAKARSVKNLRLLIVDYIQLCEGEGDTRSAAVGSISRGLKKLAKQLGCAVIALSQLNREVDKRPDKRPLLSDLRDSGEIEQDADAIWFLWRLEEADVTTSIGFDVAKNRGGKQGVSVLNFHGGTQRWSESTKRIEDFQSRPNKKGGFE